MRAFSDYLEKFTLEEREEINAHAQLLIKEYELLGKLRN